MIKRMKVRNADKTTMIFSRALVASVVFATITSIGDVVAFVTPNAASFSNNCRTFDRLQSVTFMNKKNKEAQSAYQTILDDKVTLDEEEEEDIEIRMQAKRENKIAKNAEIRKKLIAESIAPWRTLRLFLYAALGSGAALGGFITAAGVAAAYSGARTDLDLNTELVNLGIDFGAAAVFAFLFKIDFDKGKELDDDVEKKIEKKLESKAVSREIQKRAQILSNLKLSIRISADEEQRTEAPIKALQMGARQHLVIVVGPRKAVKDALLGANLMKLEDFAMSNVLVVPYEIDSKDSLVRPTGSGFGDRPVWETKPYIAEPVGDGWDDYIKAELSDAVKQGGENAKTDGIAIVVGNNGKVVKRGVGMVPWRQTVEQLLELNKKEEKE